MKSGLEMNIKIARVEGVGSTHVVLDTDQWWAVVNQ
jgi:hypothetical protein